MSSLWDYFVSESMYFQNVEGVRKDVTVIDKELCRRSWYFHQLETNCPDIVRNNRPAINSFIVAAAPFEQGNDYDASVIEAHYQAMLNGFIRTNICQKDVFLTQELLAKDGIKTAEWL